VRPLPPPPLAPRSVADALRRLDELEGGLQLRAAALLRGPLTEREGETLRLEMGNCHANKRGRGGPPARLPGPVLDLSTVESRGEALRRLEHHTGALYPSHVALAAAGGQRPPGGPHQWRHPGVDGRPDRWGARPSLGIGGVDSSRVVLLSDLAGAVNEDEDAMVGPAPSWSFGVTPRPQATGGQLRRPGSLTACRPDLAADTALTGQALRRAVAAPAREGGDSGSRGGADAAAASTSTTAIADGFAEAVDDALLDVMVARGVPDALARRALLVTADRGPARLEEAIRWVEKHGRECGWAGSSGAVGEPDDDLIRDGAAAEACGFDATDISGSGGAAAVEAGLSSPYDDGEDTPECIAALYGIPSYGEGRPMRKLVGLSEGQWADVLAAAAVPSAAGNGLTIPSPPAPAELLRIVDGRLHEGPAFRRFHAAQIARWQLVAVLLLELEGWAARSNIDIAVVDTSVLVPLAVATVSSGELPSESDLLACILNTKHLEEQLNVPGWRFRHDGGAEFAAVEVQRLWRGHWTRRVVGVWHAAARSVQTGWRLAQVRRQTRAVITEVRGRRLEAFQRIQERFQTQWSRIKAFRHVVLHLPSYSYAPPTVHPSDAAAESAANGQVARLTDLADDLVDVCYVAPHGRIEDVDAYWHQLLQLGGISSPGSRFRLIVPENAAQFPRAMPLAAKLALSPKALARLRFFVADRPCYIVSGTPGPEDVNLAVALGYPILGTAPAQSEAMRLRSWRREVLRLSHVHVAPGTECRANFYLGSAGVAETTAITRDAHLAWSEMGDEARAVVRPQGGLPSGFRTEPPPAPCSAVAKGGDSPASTAPGPSDALATGPIAASADPPRLRHLLACAFMAAAEVARGAAPSFNIDSIAQSVRKTLWERGLSPFELALPACVPGADTAAHFVAEVRRIYPVMTPTEIVSAELGALMQRLPSSPRWLLKLDADVRGRGFAFLDIESHEGLAEELAAVGRAASMAGIEGGGADCGGGGAAAHACVRLARALMQALPRCVKVVSRLHGGWTRYAEAFVRGGGVIESCPADVVGSPSVDLLVTPRGEAEVLATHETVFCPAYHAIGASFPQRSVPPSALADASEAVARSLHRAGVQGFVTVSFVALREAGAMRLWAVDYGLGFSTSLCAFRSFDFLVDGAWNPRKGGYRASITLAPGLPAPAEDPTRCFVSMEMVAHPVLARLPYDAFFSRLRDAGLSFDVREKEGLILSIVDQAAAGRLGIVAVGATPAAAFGEVRAFFDLVARSAARERLATPPPGDVDAAAEIRTFLQQQAALRLLAQLTRREEKEAGTAAEAKEAKKRPG